MKKLVFLALLFFLVVPVGKVHADGPNCTATGQSWDVYVQCYVNYYQSTNTTPSPVDCKGIQGNLQTVQGCFNRYQLYKSVMTKLNVSNSPTPTPTIVVTPVIKTTNIIQKVVVSPTPTPTPIKKMSSPIVSVAPTVQKNNVFSSIAGLFSGILSFFHL